MKILARTPGERVLIGLCTSVSYRSVIKPKVFCWLSTGLGRVGMMGGWEVATALLGEKGMKIKERCSGK
jgi:hypothetical protein